MTTLDEFVERLVDREVRVEPVDVRGRDHHVAGLLAGEVEDVVDQLLLRAGDVAGALGLVDERAQLLGAADALARLDLRDPERPQE